MEITSTKTVTIELILTEEEARWFLEMFRNPYDNIPPAVKLLQEKAFKGINDELSKHRK